MESRSKGRCDFLSLMMLSLVLATPARAEWQLSFCDDFDGAAIDQTKWKFSDLWSNQTLANNKERQCYVPTAVSQSGGELRLTATRSAMPAASCRGASTDLDYASGMITTAGCNKWEKGPACRTLRSFSQTYGYFEIKARLPKGKGLWPAFWLLPIDGSWPPEIDILEALGHEERKLYFTYHFKDAQARHRSDSTSRLGADYSHDFNTYGVDWQRDRITWYFNGEAVFQTTANVTDKPMYLLVNLAVGGNWPGNPDETTTFPAALQIKHVRVYQRSADGDGGPPAARPAACAAQRKP